MPIEKKLSGDNRPPWWMDKYLTCGWQCTRAGYLPFGDEWLACVSRCLKGN